MKFIFNLALLQVRRILLIYLIKLTDVNICLAAAFAGSAMSGYITGLIASPREWLKVLRSQSVPLSSNGIFKSCIKNRQLLQSMAKRS